MTGETAEAATGKTRRRVSAKTVSRPSAKKAKVTIHLSGDAFQRLAVHAAMLGMDRSELVESLIQRHLRRFVVSDRGGEDGGNGDIPESPND